MESTVSEQVETPVETAGDVVVAMDVTRRYGEGDAVVVLGGQAHTEVGAERTGHLLGEERARCPARDPAKDLPTGAPTTRAPRLEKSPVGAWEAV